MPFLQWWGWQQVGSKNWCVSVGLTNRLADSTPFLGVTSTSKKLTFSFDQSALNLIAGWNDLISLINSLRDSSPCSQIKNMSSVYLHLTLGFFLTLLKILSYKGVIKSTAHGGANFVPIAVSRICL